MMLLLIEVDSIGMKLDMQRPLMMRNLEAGTPNHKSNRT